MNTSQIIIAICAIAGFAISLINLGIIIYNNFIKKAKIKVEIEDFYTRYRDEGEYDFQLDCIIYAKDGDVRLRDISLYNKSSFTTKNTYNETNIQPLYKAVNGKRFDITTTPVANFNKEVEELFKNDSFRILDIKISDKDFRHLSFVGKLYTYRYSDGYDELPRSNWSLEVMYNDAPKIIMPLNLKIIGKKESVYRS